MADLLFDHEVGLGLEILRYNIGGSSTDPKAVNSLLQKLTPFCSCAKLAVAKRHIQLESGKPLLAWPACCHFPQCKHLELL